MTTKPDGPNQQEFGTTGIERPVPVQSSIQNGEHQMKMENVEL